MIKNLLETKLIPLENEKIVKIYVGKNEQKEEEEEPCMCVCVSDLLGVNIAG